MSLRGIQLEVMWLKRVGQLVTWSTSATKATTEKKLASANPIYS